MHTELAALRQEVADLSLQLELNDATYAGKVDELANEVAELRRQIAELRGPEHAAKAPPGW